ncbi:MAG: hypothetical protein Q3959_00515 [Limosilactobacillus sp.]|uniref:hypothetical protein n=1 Tax=Limosilactobacillus sp. TaxID=2773925 RepID=UPI0027040620|nr:hypothetical protein [Limosilactobacillus sp.]
MNTKKLGFTVALGATLMLAGCGAQNSSNTNSSSHKTVAAAKSSKHTAVNKSSNTEATRDGNYGKYGNKGFFKVPTELQGTWYSVSDKGTATITFGSHSIDAHNSREVSDLKATFYKQDPNFMSTRPDLDQSIVDATQSWFTFHINFSNGVNWINTRGWCQTAGAGMFFGVHTETINGTKVQVMLVASGANANVGEVYYRTLGQAKQQKDVKYSDINYEQSADEMLASLNSDSSSDSDSDSDSNHNSVGPDDNDDDTTDADY